MSMPSRVSLFAAAIAAALATPLLGQPSRTWVSGTGNDANPCTRASPCATFAEALSKTGQDGIVSCLSAGSFGSASITSPVVIDCTGIGGTLLASADGFTINPPDNFPNFAVVIRGLEISGGAGLTPSGSGILFFSGGGSLTIENSIIRNFTGGNGVDFQPSLAARLHIINSTITGNGNQATGVGAGINLVPQGAGYANVTLEDARLIGNARAGLLIGVITSNNASTNVIATRSSFIAGRYGIRVVAGAGSPGGSVLLRDSIVNGNSLHGLNADGATASILVATTSLSGNSSGVLTQNGGVIGSYGNNQLIRNGVNGTFNGFLTEN